MLIYTQDTWQGGINLLAQTVQIPANQGKIALNVRTRFGYVKPVKEAIEIEEGLPEAPTMNQGLYAFGSILILFQDGLAYYRNASAVSWTLIAGFVMSATANRIYATAVPAATLQYLRVNDDTSVDSPSGTITLETSTNPSPACLIVQDGINQPWIILPDATAREAQTYAEWDFTGIREYIPIGLQMVFFNNILFIVAPDSKSIYRSVSGRPMDFVVAIDNTGEKIAPASSTSFAVDANDIKLLAQLNANALIVITAYSAYAVALNFNPDHMIYGEPTFDQNFLFTAGVTNQFSFADILGDFAFIDKEGLKSFNAVSQLTFEGNNGVFSLSVAELFQGVVQADPCVGSFDNYTFFGVKTTYSYGSILVYDNIQKVFASLDLLVPQTPKQFASTYTDAVQRFFVMTGTKVYELYSPEAENYKQAFLYLRGFDCRNTDQGPTMTLAEIKSERIRLMFEESAETGQLIVTELVDNRVQPVGSRLTRNLVPVTSAVFYPVGGPCIATLTDNCNKLDLQTNGKLGRELSFILTWTGGAKLTKFQLEANSSQTPSNTAQQNKVYGGTN
jgi:hypothetical protein